MISKEEFINVLGDDIGSLCDKLDLESIEHEDKKELYLEYKGLMTRFLNCIADSNYDVWECRESFHALMTACNMRVQQFVEESNADDFDMTCVEPREAAKNVIRDCKNNITTISSVTTLHLALIKIAIKMQILVVSNLDESDKGESNNSDKNHEQNENADEFYDDLGCSKHEIELLEGLMGEFTEFDSYLRN